MKKLVYILSAFLLIGMTSCGGDENNGEDSIEVKDETPKLKGYEELNLSEWGFNMSIMVPNAEANGDAVVTLTERGALEVIVGSAFGIEIMYGEGDIELLKMDLKDDLVFSHEIIKEEENALIYSQDIPDAGVKTQNHFFYKAQVGNEIFEIRELLDGEYGKGMIEEMLEASKTIKAAEAKVVEVEV